MRALIRHQVLLVAGLGGAVLFLGACGEQSSGYTNSAGSLALSRDDAFLYAVDTDNDFVAVVDTASNTLVSQVPVGRSPERVVVGPDDTIYVSNRASRSVSVIKRGAGQWLEVFQIPVGVEPVGLAVTPDNQTLYVVNSTSLESPEVGTLTAIDVKTLTPRWDLVVGEEPRGVALINGNRALVTLFKQGDVVTVDLQGPAVVQRGTTLHQTVNATVLNGTSSGSAPPTFGGAQRTFHARGMSDVVVTPDGRRAFATTQWSREDTLTTTGGPTTPPGGPPGSYGGGGGGGCGHTGGVATAGLSTFDVSSMEETIPLADDLDRCDPSSDPNKDFPASALLSPDLERPIQGPVVSVMDSTGNWLFVANYNTDNVAVLPVASRQGLRPMGFDGFSFRPSSIHSVVPVGSGPNGIALSRDGKKAYVYNSFDHTISTLVQQGSGAEARLVTSGRALKVADDVLSPDVVAGRKLFFSASDSRMTAANTTMACGTCHAQNGREDGHVWMFADGPRQTPSLAGRQITGSAPFHWNGQFANLAEFLGETVNLRMGGTGATTDMAGQLAAYIDSLELPDNPLRTNAPTEAQLRGAQVFQTAMCNSCHGGQALTDNSFHDVGTLVRSGSNPDMFLDRGLNVPSLLGVSRTAPFLHDGSASTLRTRIFATRYNDLHGKTSQLSDGQLEDLVEYLKTL